MSGKELLVLRGTLEAHNGWVTALATSQAKPDLLLSASRDKTLIAWQLTRDDQQYGIPKKSFKGHSHIVQDCVISPDGYFALSASWDKTLRLWNLETGKTTQKFVGHTGDVLSVSIAKNSRQIVSASRDKTVKVWNTIGMCMSTLQQNGHTDWVSSVRFSPDDSPTVISAGWDKLVKSWDLSNYQLTADYIGHTGYVSTITISPDGTLVASAGKDGSIILWDLNKQTELYTLFTGAEVHALAFSPNRYWLTAATANSIKIFNLQERELVDELKPEFATAGKARDPEAISLAWSVDGQNLFAGYTDSVIRVWQVMTST